MNFRAFKLLFFFFKTLYTYFFFRQSAKGFSINDEKKGSQNIMHILKKEGKKKKGGEKSDYDYGFDNPEVSFD